MGGETVSTSAYQPNEEQSTTGTPQAVDEYASRSDVAAKTTAYVEQNPVQAVLICATAGLLFGLWFAGNQRRALRGGTLGGRRAVSTSVDFQLLINHVSLDFERRRGIRVDEGARMALIIPALAHREGVNEDLRAGTISMNFIEECVFSILDRARKFAHARGINYISREAVQDSMDEDCPYLGWC
jgi:hypothetical protein